MYIIFKFIFGIYKKSSIALFTYSFRLFFEDCTQFKCQFDGSFDEHPLRHTYGASSRFNHSAPVRLLLTQRPAEKLTSYYTAKPAALSIHLTASSIYKSNFIF